MKPKASIVYLGSSVAVDGNVDAELARRLGMAQADFKTLDRVWSHSSLSAQEKHKMFNTCVVGRLLYGLQVVSLRKAARKKLDGFQARCLRKILRVQPAYWSRVSNETVLNRIGATRLSTLLREHQLTYLGKLARRPLDCPVRRLVFDCIDMKRRRGRPRLEWAKDAVTSARATFDTADAFHACLLSEPRWRRHVRNVCRAMPTRC